MINTERAKGGNGSSGSNHIARGSALSSLRPLISSLLSRVQFAIRHGLTYNNNTTRDIYLQAGYPTSLTYSHYLAQYERGDIAERIVKYYPEAIWAPGISVFENEDPDVITPFEQRVDDLANRIDLYGKYKRAHILAQLGHYSVLLIGVAASPGTGENKADGELPRSRRDDGSGIIFLSPYSEERAEIESPLVETITDSRYGLPQYYSLKSGGISRTQDGISRKTVTGTAQRVHWSRIIHLAQDLLEDDIYGTPVLRSIFNRLLDLEKILSAGGEHAWKNMDPGKHFDLSPEAQAMALEQSDTSFDSNEIANDPAIVALRDQIADFDNGLKRSLLTSGVTLKTLESKITNFAPLVDSVITVICAAKGIQQRILMGSERGELASSQDRSNRNDAVTAMRQSTATPWLRLFLDRMIDEKYRYLPRPEQYEVAFPEEEELTEEQKSKQAQTYATANAQQSLAGGGLIYDSNEIRDKLGDGPMEEEIPDNVNDNNDANDAVDINDQDAASLILNRSRSLSRVRPRPVQESLRIRKLRWCASRGIKPARKREMISLSSSVVSVKREEAQ